MWNRPNGLLSAWNYWWNFNQCQLSFAKKRPPMTLIVNSLSALLLRVQRSFSRTNWMIVLHIYVLRLNIALESHFFRWVLIFQSVTREKLHCLYSNDLTIGTIASDAARGTEEWRVTCTIFSTRHVIRDFKVVSNHGESDACGTFSN